jgi:hypothetical protein
VNQNFVVLQWYYNDRDSRCIIPELLATFGPFLSREIAEEWISTATTWGGWGRYEYQTVILNHPKGADA